MDIAKIHEEAEQNKDLINIVNTDLQKFVDMCFLDEFKDELNSWFDEYIEKNMRAAADKGKTEDIEYFTVTNRHLDTLRFGPGIESTVFNPFTFVELRDFFIHNKRYVNYSDLGKVSYTVSIEGIKAAYDCWVDKFKELDVKIISIDEFSLSEKEYKKVCKSWFKFEKDFTIKISF